MVRHHGWYLRFPHLRIPKMMSIYSNQILHGSVEIILDINCIQDCIYYQNFLPMLCWTPRIRINLKKKHVYIYINWNHSSKIIPYVAMPLGIILRFCISWRFGVGPPAVGNPYDGMQKLPGLLYARSFPSPGSFLLILYLKHCKYRQIQFLRGVILKISRIEPSDRFSCGTRWVQGVSLANNIHHPCPGTISASCSEISSSMFWR